jgi:hypothetical protein
VQNGESDDDDVETGGCMLAGTVETSERISVKLNLDTGASSHFIKDAELLTNIEDIDPIEVRGIIGRTKITKKGMLEPFGKVFYMPGGNINILSCSKLVSDGFTVEMDCVGNKFVVYQDKKIAWEILKNRNGIYSMEMMLDSVGVIDQDVGAAVRHNKTDRRKCSSYKHL